MYDIRQFRPALYLLLLMGMTGFALAAESPGLWLLAVFAIGLHWWLNKRGKFKPLPRLLANTITLVSLAFAFLTIRSFGSPIITIGNFLVLLQLVKLYELHNRDYAQLLVLSLLLMVAASISTASLVFGVMLVVYLFVSMYCCLLFHLKVENESALAAQTLPSDKLNEATVKQDQRFLPRSMKKLAALVSLAAIFMAVFVFLFFPRGTGAGVLGQLQFKMADTLTGFSDSDGEFNQINNITQNTEIVAHVRVTEKQPDGAETPIKGTMPLYLRGRTADLYKRNEISGAWRFIRRDDMKGEERSLSGDGVQTLYRGTEAQYGGDQYRQKITLKPTGTRTLFALAGPITIRPDRDAGKFRFFREDQTLSLGAPLTQRLEYEVVSRDATLADNPIDRVIKSVARNEPMQRHWWGWPTILQVENRELSQISPRIAELARRPDVSGRDAQGRPLADLRPENARTSEVDAAIAQNIEKWLRTQLSYTLENLTFDQERDPVEQFIFERKKGHCEYFAAAMVLMCQSLGMDARRVTGFKCDEYDATMGDYYIVRQSHAHAWVEVRTNTGWQTFDPTSANSVDGPAGRSAWQKVKHFFAFLEYKWQSAVVAYDGERREDIISKLDRSIVNTAVNSNINPRKMGNSIRDWWNSKTDAFNGWLNRNAGEGWLFTAKVIVGFIALLVAILLYVILNYLLTRWRMRRRAARIGLDALPASQQIKLARQLGFYEHLMKLLERRQILRPVHLTPAEFGESLTFLPNEAYDAIGRLTRAFYSIRYGDAQLSQDQQRDLEETVATLEPVLDNRLRVR